MSVAAGDGAPPAAPAPASRTRRLLTGLALVVVVAAALAALWRERADLADAVDLLSWWVLALSAVPAALAVGLQAMSWLAVLRGLGADAPARDALRVFFWTQLGKYLPGSVWPAVGQMAAGRRWGTPPRTMLTANLFSLVVNLVTGLLVASLTLPWSGGEAFSRFWWLLIVAPVLLVLLVPRVLPAVLDRLLTLARRAPLGDRVPVRATLRGAGWSALAWLGYGLQTYLLLLAAGQSGVDVAVAALGASAFAVCVGVLAIPFPAGAGIRETAFVVALSATVPSGVALLVTLASRLTLVVVDLALAAVGAGVRSRVAAPAPTPER